MAESPSSELPGGVQWLPALGGAHILRVEFGHGEPPTLILVSARAGEHRIERGPRTRFNRSADFLVPAGLRWSLAVLVWPDGTRVTLPGPPDGRAEVIDLASRRPTLVELEPEPAAKPSGPEPLPWTAPPVDEPADGPEAVGDYEVARADLDADLSRAAEALSHARETERATGEAVQAILSGARADLQAERAARASDLSVLAADSQLADLRAELERAREEITALRSALETERIARTAAESALGSPVPPGALTELATQQAARAASKAPARPAEEADRLVAALEAAASSLRATIPAQREANPSAATPFSRLIAAAAAATITNPTPAPADPTTAESALAPPSPAAEPGTPAPDAPATADAAAAAAPAPTTAPAPVSSEPTAPASLERTTSVSPNSSEPTTAEAAVASALPDPTTSATPEPTMPDAAVAPPSSEPATSATPEPTTAEAADAPASPALAISATPEPTTPDAAAATPSPEPTTSATPEPTTPDAAAATPSPDPTTSATPEPTTADAAVAPASPAPTTPAADSPASAAADRTRSPDPAAAPPVTAVAPDSSTPAATGLAPAPGVPPTPDGTATWLAVRPAALPVKALSPAVIEDRSELVASVAAHAAAQAAAEALATISAPAPGLRRALVELAREDSVAAGALLAGLLPAQGAILEEPLSYDLTVRGFGTFAVTVGHGGAEVQRLTKRRPRKQAAFHISGEPLVLAELLAGDRTRLGRFRPSARITGRRKRAKALRAFPESPLSLAEAAAAGARLEPSLVYGALPYAVAPEWTRGHVFTVAQEITELGPRAWYVTARDGVRLSVVEHAAGAAADATVTMSRAAFDRLLKGEPATPGDLPVIRGDRTAVATLKRWTDLARA